jgi:murein DD-endopeptidase MepM/ murein hydrolase activator NlpD
VTTPPSSRPIIDIGAQRYVLIAHFQRNSIQVGVGDRVEVGDQLGRTGNSGNSFEPHIHLHVQDTPTFEPGTGNGVAIDFGPHWADGARVEGGAASSGQFVEHAERP